MKARLKKIMIISFLTFAGIGNLYSQADEVLGGFSVKLNGGILSFHGDLSNSGFNPALVLKDNSKFGFSFSAMKEFNNFVAVQGQYFSGNLRSVNEDLNQYFNGSLNEISFSARISPFALMNNKKEGQRLKPFIEIGLGRFGYRSCRRFIDTDDIYPPCYGYESDGKTKTPRKHSLTIPVGIGLSIPVNQYLSAEISHVYRITNTDLIDATVNPTSGNDAYSFTSLGLRFSIKQPENFSQLRDRQTSPFKDVEVDPEINKEEMEAEVLNIYVESLMDDVVTSGDVFSVHIRINKGNYTGPAKLVQRYPEGFNAVEASSTNGRFSFNNRNVLIEWDNMPADSMINFTYYVRLNNDVAGSQTITGRFEYEEKEKWNTVRFNNYIFADNMMKELKDDIEIGVEKPVKEVKAEKAAEDKDPVIKEVKKDKPQEEVKANIDPLILKDPLDGIVFRIQCGAFKDAEKGGKMLVEKYGITEDMREVYENGWFKYTIGSFSSYVEAVNYKNSFIKRTKLYTAFIVAYKNGKRLDDIKDAFK